MASAAHDDPESRRLLEDARREANWKRWGPYLSERQWGTVREDYSRDGAAWDYFPHEHARSRAYRWGEDGLFGWTDRQCRLCFALALWNGRDPILKERLFGLSGNEGNHGEDVKECYYYLDATPTSSYLRALYKYPQREFPYARLVEENRGRGIEQGEFELADTGVFDDGRYFDVTVEYAKAAPEDVLVRITVANRGDQAARLDVLPTLWFRNTWSWDGAVDAGARPTIRRQDERTLVADETTLGLARLAIDGGAEALFTENETDRRKLHGTPNGSPWVKDAFDAYVVRGRADAVSPRGLGTKAAFLRRLEVPAGGEVALRLRLSVGPAAPEPAFGAAFERVFALRREEAERFYAARLPAATTDEERVVVRQAYAGLLWSKQFYHYVVETWIDGDRGHPAPEERRSGRNADWRHVYSRDVISMPDKWEYPWFAAWDVAFHMIPMSRIDADFAKRQLELFLREWYMHPNGQIPAYEWALSDVNPPVHAWAAWRVYKRSAPPGSRDRRFLASAFQKLLLNFTWWVNRKDSGGRHVFSGGFLGLDNIGVFDRSAPLPIGGHLEQADATAWMAFYCGTMLSIALELAREDPVYEDMASKFFEHYVAIIDAMNHLGGTGLWSEQDGFYYDQIRVEGGSIPLRVRSMVGLLPLIAVEILEEQVIERLPGFAKRMRWFLENRPELARHVTSGARCARDAGGREGRCLLAIPSRERLERVLGYLLDEDEFLSPYGIRSLSRVHAREPFRLRLDGVEHRVDYAPGEGTTRMFGGNSNWRGPIWFPVNYLLIEALERYDHFYGDDLTVELPKGSGRRVALNVVAREIARRLLSLFLPGRDGRRPCHGDDPRYANDPHWRELVLFYEHFHADTGRGIGASHQTGWTALAASLIEALAAERTAGPATAPRRPRARR